MDEKLKSKWEAILETEGLGTKAKTPDALSTLPVSYEDEKKAEPFQPFKPPDLTQRASYIAQLDPACDPRSGGLSDIDGFASSMGFSNTRVRHFFKTREDAGFIHVLGPDEKGKMHYYSCQNSCSNYGDIIRGETKAKKDTSGLIRWTDVNG